MSELQITAPELPEPTHAAWVAIFDLSDRVPAGWTIIGGQLAHMHAWQRGVMPTRTTHDVDAGLDVRGVPRIAASTTRALLDAGVCSQDHFHGRARCAMEVRDRGNRRSGARISRTNRHRRQ